MRLDIAKYNAFNSAPLTYKKAHLAPKLVAVLKCCTPDQFRGWAERAPQVYDSPTGLAHLFCHECEPAYRKEMTVESKCVRDKGLLGNLEDDSDAT